VRASDRIGLEREPQKPTTGPGSGYGGSEFLIREVSRHSLGLIRGHVANRRAAKRAQALTRP
jgi:hypothetical protein